MLGLYLLLKPEEVEEDKVDIGPGVSLFSIPERIYWLFTEFAVFVFLESF